MDELLSGDVSLTTSNAGRDDIIARIEKKLSGQEPTVDKVPEKSDSEPVMESAAKEPTGVTKEKENAAEGAEDKLKQESGDEEALEIDAGQLAGVLGLENESVVVDDEGNLFINAKVDGKIHPVKLADLVKSYQTEASATKRFQSLAEEKQRFDSFVAENKKRSEELNQQFSQAIALGNVLEQHLLGEYQAIDWNALRQANPAEWAARQQEFQQRQAQIGRVKQIASDHINQQLMSLRTEQEKRNAAVIQQEAESLLLALPTWSDAEVAKKEFGELQAFLTSTYGIPEQVVKDNSNHRLILMALDAMKYRTGRKDSEKAVEKVRKLPKIVKPGGKGDPKAAVSQQQQQKLLRLKKTGSVNDLASILMDRL